MKKLLPLSLVLLASGGLWMTGYGSRLINEFELASTESRIRSNLENLKESQADVATKVHTLRARAEAGKSNLARQQAERDELDQACHRLAAKINAIDPVIVPVEASFKAMPVSNPAPLPVAKIGWGPHEISRADGISFLTQWGKDVRDLDTQLEAGAKMIEEYEHAASVLEQEKSVYKESIVALEQKLNELLTHREVLKVQDEISAILAGIEGRDVKSETGALLEELRTENDNLEGSIKARSMAFRQDGRLVRPTDDLRDDSTNAVLVSYGVTVAD
ncbi:MAG: hypothetical protein GY711_00230 [bacterium]|nr:hypothetical protein [bacterium]